MRNSRPEEEGRGHDDVSKESKRSFVRSAESSLDRRQRRRQRRQQRSILLAGSPWTTLAAMVLAAITKTNSSSRSGPRFSFFCSALVAPSFVLRGRIARGVDRRLGAGAALSSDELWPASSESLSRLGDDRYCSYDEDEDDEERAELEFASLAFDSVVKVHCTHSEPDHSSPWQRLQQTSSTSSGFVVDVPGIGVRVVTNAHSVEYASSLRVQRRGDERKYATVVEAVGNECDLALVRVVEEEEEDFLEGLYYVCDGDDDDDDGDDRSPRPALPLEFGPLPHLQDEVEVIGYPTGGDSMSVTSGVVSRIEIVEYAQAGAHLLAIQIDAAINSGNSGGPVVDGDLRVVGVAFQSLDEAENIGYVVPVSVVRHFLEDVRRSAEKDAANHHRQQRQQRQQQRQYYPGFCSVGVRLELLENRAYRESLGLGDRAGVRVRSIAPTSPAASVLRPGDVLLAVDGVPVSNDGRIPFRRGERVPLGCYVQTRFPGDVVELEISRDGGATTKVRAPVDVAPRLVPACLPGNATPDRPPPYVIVSGLVFTALSLPLLDAWGAWDGHVSDDVNDLLGHCEKDVERAGDQIVVLSQVLVHDENMGYDKLWAKRLQSLNGAPVRSLRHLKELLDSHESPENDVDDFLRFEFAPRGDSVVLRRSRVKEVTEEICRQQSIARSFYLSPEDEDDRESESENESAEEKINGDVVYGESH